MTKAKLKNGQTLDLPFEEMLDFIALHSDQVEAQKSEKAMPRRRTEESKECVA